jgi:hypothetical protein
MAKEKNSHDPHGNHAKHHQMFEETHVECYRKDFHGDHMEIIEGLKKLIQNVGKKIIHMIITWKTHRTSSKH